MSTQDPPEGLPETPPGNPWHVIQTTWPMTMADLFPGGVDPSAIIHAPRIEEREKELARHNAAHILSLGERLGAERAVRYVHLRFGRLLEWREDPERRLLLEALDVERLPPAVVRAVLLATERFDWAEERREFRTRAVGALVRRLGVEGAARLLEGIE